MDITESDQIFKNGVKHIRLDCNWLCTQDWLKDNLRDAINDYLDSEE